MEPFNPFPPAKLSQFKRAPIELIVGQVRVPLVPVLLEVAGISTFQALAKAEYPHLRREEQVGFRLSSDEGPRGEKIGLWRFEDTSREWTLTVAPDYVAIETREYKDFREFRDRLVNAMAWYSSAYGCTMRTRIGLRYIDRFLREKYPYFPDNWLSNANPELLSLIKRSQHREQTAFLEHRFALGDSWGLTVRVTAKVGAAPDGSELLLDVDAFDAADGDFVALPTVLDSLKMLDNSAFGWAADGLLDVLEKA